MNWNTIIDYITYGSPQASRRIVKTTDEWRKILSAEQFKITRLKQTERAYSGTLCTVFEDGKYVCANCEAELFDSLKKYNANCGWPSFTEPISYNAIKFVKDKSYEMLRVETVCNCCDAHLGHVFPDGPQPTGLRFCINSMALSLRKPSKIVFNIPGYDYHIAKQMPYA